MTFREQILSTFLGSLAGFIFGILLFYLTERMKVARQRKDLLKGLKKEFNYNFLLLDKWLEDTDRVLRGIATGDRQVFVFYRYTDFQRLFTNLCFQQRILYDVLPVQDIADLNSILWHFDIGVSNWCNSYLDQWRSERLPPAEANRIFQFENDRLKEFKQKLGDIIARL